MTKSIQKRLKIVYCTECMKVLVVRIKVGVPVRSEEMNNTEEYGLEANENYKKFSKVMSWSGRC
ncbi:hypothetical protein A2U01_0061282 [Trifolium medium]|uniref:Uncharacterized protein n=1 Tax=Trifolium medium TaxID=97028 RepID=A0A392RW75_9FABA|nr:hypothetical protein [Trifolium medium]